MRRRLAWAAAVVCGAFGYAAPAHAQGVLVVGDSLSIGTTPHLKRELGGVRVRSNGRIGRPSGEAVGVLRSLVTGSERAVVFDAGTNDDPGQPGRLAANLNAARRVAGSACLVVATVTRPPYRGVSVDGLNRAVRAFASSAPNVQLVDWRGAVASNPGLLNRDRVHPTPAGYGLRGRLFANAIGACGGAGGGGGSGAPPGDVGGLPPAGTEPPDDVPDEPPADDPDDDERDEPSEPPREKRVKPRLGSQSPVTLAEPVEFESRGAVLRGEVIAPAGEGRHPAVVMLHDAGAATREPLREQAEYLAQHGVAVLIYDKRGAGESTGGPDPTYDELAEDARAGIALLRNRDDVRSEGIGVWGLGEGGYVAPLAAGGNEGVAAVMVVSPPAVAPASREQWAVRRQMRAAGATSGGGAISTWYSLAADLESEDYSFDPAPAWRRVSQPVLAVWGGDDAVVPARASAAALIESLGAGENEDRTFTTFPGAAHNLGVEEEGYRAGTAPGFKELGADWLRSHLSRRPPPAAINTPLPPADATKVERADEVSLLERWPVQLAWLVLPALGLVAVAVREWRRRRRGADTGLTPRDWAWLGGVVAVDLLALAALAYAVASIVGSEGEGVDAVAGVPVVILAAWGFVAAAAIVTAVVARTRPRGLPLRVVSASSAAWLLLAAFWLV